MFLRFIRTILLSSIVALGLVETVKGAPQSMMQKNINKIDHYGIKNDNVECDICQAAVNWVENKIESNDTISNIEKFLDQVCEITPLRRFEKDCEGIVDAYTQDIIDGILIRETPEKLCQDIHLCQSKISQTLNFKCELCHAVVSKTEELLQKDFMERDIEKILEHVCDYLFDMFKGECGNFIEEFVPYLMKWISEKETPEVVCRQIDVCKSNIELYAH